MQDSIHQLQQVAFALEEQNKTIKMNKQILQESQQKFDFININRKALIQNVNEKLIIKSSGRVS